MKTTGTILLSIALLVACGPSEEPAGGAGGDAGSPAENPAAGAEARRLLEEGDALVETDPARAIEVLGRSLARAETARGRLALARAKLATAEVVMPGTIPPEVAPDLERALELAPASAPALLLKAELLGLGRDAAQEILRRIVDLPIAEGDGVAWLARARAATHLRDELREKLEQAANDFAKAAALRPRDAQLRLLWGDLLYRKLQREDEARKVLEECVRLDPEGRSGTEARRLLDEM